MLGAAIVAAGCGAADDPTPRGPSARPPAVYSAGQTVVGLEGGPAELEQPPVAPLAGWLTPAAAPSRDRRYLAYNAWDELRADDPRLSWDDQGIEPGDRLATPSIRVYDTLQRTDEVLEEGAFSVAWRGDGALAYFRGAERDYRAAVPYVGDVVVRTSLEAEPEVWSAEPARYIVVAWAGSTLVGYREREGEALDVVAFDEPGRMRVLAGDSGLVAISPDGTRVFVEQGPAQGRPVVRVLDLGTGSTVARLDLTKVDRAVGTVSYSGDWVGRRVVAPSATGLAVFRVARGTIGLERALRVASPQGVAEPRFAAGGRRVTAWTTAGNGAAFLDCDLSLGRCARTVPLPAARGTQGFPAWRRPLYNPSRPQ
jgi:hypothetical protein